mgnify:CR=1 FL=1
MRYEFPYELTRDGAGFWLVTFPDVPEAGTDDPDREAALAEAADSLIAALGGYVEVRAGLSNVELGRRLGLTETAVRRLLDLDHESRIQGVLSALESLGRRAVLEIEEIGSAA